MLLIGDKVVDFTASPGCYEACDSVGRASVGFLNGNDIQDVAFGTPNSVRYNDSFYHEELFLRLHGCYSLRVVDPMKVYEELIPDPTKKVDITEVHQRFLPDFLDSLQVAVRRMSDNGIRISHLASGREGMPYLLEALNMGWARPRGLEVVSVEIQSLFYDGESKRKMNAAAVSAALGNKISAWLA